MLSTMKNLFLAAALLLAGIAAAQPQTKHLPVMSLSDPDAYLEIKHQPGLTLDSVVPTAMAFQRTDNAPQATGPQVDMEAVAAYLMYQQAQEQVYSGKFYEELGYLYGTGAPLTPQQFKYLLTQASIWQYVMEK